MTWVEKWEWWKKVLVLDISLGAPSTKSASGLNNVGVEAISSDGGSSDYSETNVQVEGVDEADIIKTDGEYIYAVVQKNLFIVKAYPAEKSEVITTIAFESRPKDIFIKDNRLVVFGYNDQMHNRDNYKKIQN